MKKPYDEKEFDSISGGINVITIENDDLLVEISANGAELQKVYNKKEQFDYLWNGNADFWGSRAPNLFPIIGRLNEYKYKKDDQIYELPQHGFAKEMTFEAHQESDIKAVFTLKNNTETTAMYPYEFTLMIEYTLVGALLAVDYRVENHSKERMPFSIGGHPAFNVPLNGAGSYEDYTITIQPKEEVKYFESNPLPYRSGNRKVLQEMKDGVMTLSHETFREGLIIIDEPKLDAITLEGPEKHGVTLNVIDFPYVCLWTKEQADAPFICIEPFFGLPDIAGEVGTLEDKGGIILLESGEVKQLGFTMDLF